MLAEQQERAAAARRSLVRARQVAAVCVVLAVGAIVAAILAYFSSQRANRAEEVAQQSRVQAETLLGYLTDGLARELESSGRLDVIASLAKQEIDYFHGLPDELAGPATRRTASQALVQYARAQRRLGDLDAAWNASTESVGILEKLQKDGDGSEATVVGLARALEVQAGILRNRQDATGLPTAQRAVDVLGPLLARPDASAAARETAVRNLTTLGFQQLVVSDSRSVETLRRAIRVASELGGREVKDTYVSGLYAQAAAWLVSALLQEGNFEEARSVGLDGATVADKVIAQRPGDRSALFAQGLIQSALGDAAVAQSRPQDALPFHIRAVTVQQTLVDLDPGNKISQNNLGSNNSSLAESYWALGEIDDALETYDATNAAMKVSGEGGAALRLVQLNLLAFTALRNADAGHLQKARGFSADIGKYASDLRSSEPATSTTPAFADLLKLRVDSEVAFAEGDARSARGICAEMNARLQKMQKINEADEQNKYATLYLANELKARSELVLKDYSAAEQSARAALAAKEKWIIDPQTDGRVKASQSTMIALALVRQDRSAEARQVIEPVVKLHREIARHNHGDQIQKVEMASALYVQALVDPQRRTALLREARSLLDSVPGPVKALASTRTWSDRIREAAG